MQNKYRYKIILEYLGAGFFGWQRQKEVISVQQVVEDAIAKLTRQEVILFAAGRTDTGVNAYGQVAHFDLDSYYEPYKMMKSINHFVKSHKVGIIDCKLVDQEFHARFSAKKRHYIYKIVNRRSVPIIEKELKYWVRDKLDINAMQEGANYLHGKHDFSSFRASYCQSESAIKTLSEIRIIKDQEDINIYISAPSFLHHMVRNIVGSLVMVGKKTWAPIKIKEILDLKDRTKAAATAPANALYFLKVDY